MQHMICRTMEGGQSKGETKQHHKMLIVSVSGSERTFLLIPLCRSFPSMQEVQHFLEFASFFWWFKTGFSSVMALLLVPAWKGSHFPWAWEAHKAPEEQIESVTTSCLTVLLKSWLAFHYGSRCLWAIGAVLSHNQTHAPMSSSLDRSLPQTGIFHLRQTGPGNPSCLWGVAAHSWGNTRTKSGASILAYHQNTTDRLAQALG